MTLSPEHARLASALRALRARTGLSLTGLAARTAYSRSSWERYLNGRTLAPRQAVRDLCRLAGEPEGRVLALWEITESGWSGRASQAPRVPTVPRQRTRPPGPPARPSGGPAPASAPPHATGTGPHASPPERRADGGDERHADAREETAPRRATGVRNGSAPHPADPPAPAPSPGTPPAREPAVRSDPARPPGVRDLPAPVRPVRRRPPAGHRTMTCLALAATVGAVVVAGAAVALLLLTGGRGGPGAAAPPTAAPAAPSRPDCRGAACEDRSPVATGCGARPDTLARRRMSTGAWMEVRYNRRCGAGWARMWGADIGDRIEVGRDGPGHPVRRAAIEDDVDTDSFVYTSMTAAPAGTVLRACFVPSAASRPECFDSRVRR